MTDSELYRQILGLTPPWRVAHIALDTDTQEVRVFVEHDPAAGSLCCPECGQTCPGYDLREERVWRHLDTCQFQTWLICCVPRVECPEHGVKTVRVPWSEPGSHFTRTFECFAIALLQATKVQAKAAGLLRLSPSQVHDLMHRAVLRGLSRRDDQAVVEHVTLDEKSVQQGHHYVTVLGDAAGKRVLDVVEGRTTEATQTLLLGSLSGAQREKVQSVAMDMWQPFAQAAQAVLPGADIVHDRFHIASYLGQAVDETRKAEHRKLSKQGDSPLAKSKYIWLKNPQNLTAKQKALFAALSRQDLETAKVWSFKEAFREFFSAGSVQEGATFFANWYKAAIELGNRPLSKVAQRLQEHLPGLLAYLRHHTSNAFAEGLNSQIQQIKVSARGFRKPSNFRIAILFFLGKLDLNPQESP
jgi:transposase